MSIYEKSAYFYAKGPYPQYSEKMAEMLPFVLEKFDAQPRTILDLACGEGTFAVIMAKNGFQVTGVDLSPYMLEFAGARAGRENVEVEFLRGDMRSLQFEGTFDLVTCWYDSLNYVLDSADLEKTFSGVHSALKKEGLFIFDINTIYGLFDRQRHPSNVKQDTHDVFEVHRSVYDFERNIATLRITGFVKESAAWVRIDEKHNERGYTIGEIRKCLTKSGLHELALWGNLQEMSEPAHDSVRIWFVTRK